MNKNTPVRSSRGLLLCAVLISSSARAASVSLAWNANTESNLAGYRLYYAGHSLLGQTTAQAMADATVTKVPLGVVTAYTLSTLSAQATYYFRLTAYDTANLESAFNVDATSGLNVEVSTVTPAAPLFSACDANKDSFINVVDVQLEVNMALGAASCTADINLDSVCNVVDVQRGVNAALGGACVVGP